MVSRRSQLPHSKEILIPSSKNPLVSVVMPFYNGEKYLKLAVDSILGQTLGDFELLAIDDCSKDGSLQVLSEYRDPRLVVLCNEQNMGLTKSINRGLRESKGEYVARMDADDMALPKRFEAQVALLEKSAVGMTHSNVLYIDGEDRETGASNRDFSEPISNWKMLFDSYLFHPTFLWKRKEVEEKVGSFNEKFVVAQDFDFAWRVHRAVGIEGIQENLLRYRIHTTNITSTRRATQQALVSEASTEHIAEQLGMEVGDAAKAFAGVRDLSLFRDAADWNPERVLDVAPRYFDLWASFLERRSWMDWRSRPESLKRELVTNLIDATGILIAARDVAGFNRFMGDLGKSGLMPPAILMRAIMRHRWREKRGLPNGQGDHPKW